MELLGKKTDTISTTYAEKATKVKAKKAARVMSSSFVITSTSDSDVITTRESHRTKQMERRLKERRRRVAKNTSVAERRKDHVVATVSKAQKLARPHAISPAEEEPVSAGR
ncbi:Hypp2898 [Branchiostoma lanceolatum]|uniref:Hypp2898 protein n=1 Tax=Branchiostoma lanceolatum TaxID=7740 RepID=A0A8K0EPS9_BRALA|nr:Hypp2898 [Branchiostoma lanceolatum]